MPIRPQLKHLGIYVDDIDRMERFYSEAFGLVVTDRGTVARLGNRKIVFMSNSPDAHHEMVLVGGKDPNSGPSVVFQMSFLLKSLAELREVAKRMDMAGAKDLYAINHGIAWSVYASDPEGNGLEAYVDSPWYIVQPHGKPLDLTLSDEEIMAKTEAAVRQDPTYRPRRTWVDDMTRLLS